MSKVLIVDDQDAVRTALQVLFEIHGLETVCASGPDEALTTIRDEDIGVVVQDMNFGDNAISGREGVELFRATRKLDPDLPVLLMTAWTSLETAVELVKEGAADYLAKPWDDQKLLRSVENLMKLRALHVENTRMRAQASRAREDLARRYNLCGIVYASQPMHHVVALAVHVAPSDVPVIITGPNGVGKEKIAEIVQANSRRQDKPFVRVNVGGLPDELLEAELFGAEPGAYTGAVRARVGRFEAAEGGTLFLDEIGNLSLSGQAKLLRVLQTGEFERLGSSQTRKVDVRVVSATNLDLAKAIAAGRFREDLYFRLNVIELRVPSLAERPEDLLPLAQHFLAVYAPPTGVCRLSPAAERALLQHEWPGNVRELQNRIQRASLVCHDRVVEPVDLDLAGEAEATSTTGVAARDGASDPGALDPERAATEAALLRAGGMISRAAAELGLSRQALYRRMDRLGIVVERKLKS